MKNKVKTKNLIIGKAINQEIKLPIVEVGASKKCVGIVGGIHGNEPESLFIIKDVFKRLMCEPNLNVRAKFLLGANPFGLINNTRVGSFDHVDLNRAFPGKPDGTLTERLAFAIFKEFKECDLVIDIHSVTNVGTFMGMLLSTQNKSMQQKTADVIRLLNPPLVWKAVEGTKYMTAMDEALLKVGVCGIGIEVPRLDQMTDVLLEKIVSGVTKIILSDSKPKPFTNSVAVVANAKRYFSDFGGLYEPVMPLMSPVKMGQTVGIITDLNTLQEKKLKSKFDGVLFVQSTKKVVKTGDKIYVVAEKIGEFK